MKKCRVPANGRRSALFVVAEEVAHRDPERLRDPRHDDQRWVALAPLDATDVRPVETGAFGQVFLTPASGISQLSHVCPEALLDGLHDP